VRCIADGVNAAVRTFVNSGGTVSSQPRTSPASRGAYTRASSRGSADAIAALAREQAKISPGAQKKMNWTI
jgi:hypothetical protein